MDRAAQLYRIGISGWNYPRWRRSFYPKGLPQRQELEYAAHTFNSIELNGTFYSLKSLKSFQACYDAAPDGFLYSLKGPRFITHMKKLHDVETPLANFFASGVLALGEKLGPILWQLPPFLRFDRARLESFFDLLPRTTREAARLARKANEKLKTVHDTRARVQHRIRYALEVRHPSFLEHGRELVGFLRQHDVALVCADAAADWPVFETVTSDFAYARLHGGRALYASGYTTRELGHWAQLAKRWSRGGRPVFIYFDNDALGHAPFDAIALQERLSKGGTHARKSIELPRNDSHPPASGHQGLSGFHLRG